jgi:hypothetical protein
MDKFEPPRLTFRMGAANFGDSNVSPLGPEDFSPDLHTEELDRANVSLGEYNAFVEVKLLEEQFLMTYDGGEQ